MQVELNHPPLFVLIQLVSFTQIIKTSNQNPITSKKTNRFVILPKSYQNPIKNTLNHPNCAVYCCRFLHFFLCRLNLKAPAVRMIALFVLVGSIGRNEVSNWPEEAAFFGVTERLRRIFELKKLLFWATIGRLWVTCGIP